VVAAFCRQRVILEYTLNIGFTWEQPLQEKHDL